jgi:tetratricopeptide (TPR) repeat protein
LHVAASHYAQLQQFGKAAEIWERSVELAPNYAGPRVGLALAAMEQGNDDQAIAILEQALADGCRTADAFLQLATAREKVGKLEEAEAAAQQGVEAFPQDTELWISLGQIQLQREKLKESEASLLQALNLRPDAASAHFALGTVTARLGRAEEAEKHRQRFAEIRAEHPLQTERFHVVYEATLRMIVVTTLCNAASEYERQGELDDAERLYREALELAPRSPDTYRWLASLYHQQGRIGDALVVQQRLVELEPGRVENHLNLASLSAELGDRTGMEASLRAAQALAPNDPRLQNIVPE